MSWTLWSGQSGGGGGGGGIASINGDTTSAQLISAASTGTDFTISTSGGTTTVAIPSASATARGLITTSTQTIAGAKTFSSDVVCGSGTASTTTTTGALQVTGGIGATGALNHAGTYRCTNTTDSTSISSGSAVFSGGVGVTKTLYVGTGIGVTTGNVLVTSGNIGRDTGVSGSLTDCPTNVFCNAAYIKTSLSWAANSATTGLSTSVDSGTSITFKSGATSLLGISSTQLNFFKRFHLGSGENTIVDFMTSTLSSTSATPVTGYTFDTSGRDNWDFNLEVHFMGRRSDTPGEHIHVSKAMYFKRVSGTNSHIMTTQVYLGRSTLTTADIQQYVSGNNIGFEFVGEAGKTIKGFWWVTNTMGST